MNTITTALPGMDNFNHFWAEITPVEHISQIHTSPSLFIESLEIFAGNGIQQDEGVIVIATAAHIDAVNERLIMRGFNIEAAILKQQYIPLDAEEILAKFMVDDLPDELLFEQFIVGLLTQASNNKRRVRAFSELVAILWANGNVEARHRLERLWDELCQKKFASLFCAYPKSGFTQNIEASIIEICKLHSKVI